MDDLDELKGRVERATRVLSEREAEEQGRHSKLVSLVAALESKSLEARREKEEAEARLGVVEAENAELRGLLAGLLDAVEDGSRSRFADAIYALEARVSGLAPATRAALPEAAGPETAADETDADETDADETDADETAKDETAADETPEAGAAEAEAAEPEDAEPEAEAPKPDGARLLADEDDEALDDFTAQLAAGCAVEEELAREAEALRAEAADDAKALLARIRQQVEAPNPELDPEVAPETEAELTTGAEPDGAGEQAAAGAAEPLEAAAAGEPGAAAADEADEPFGEEASAILGLAEEPDDAADGPLAELPSEADGTLIEEAALEEPAGDASEDESREGQGGEGEGGEEDGWTGKRQAAS